jgi:recombinational DNA repair protein (RecF pathway)
VQGYIVRLQRARNEDLVVSILTNGRLETVYRFYGARHSAINLGYKIDFEIERSLQSPMGRLRDVIHLGFPWLHDHDRARHWQRFVSLFHPHLKDSEETGGFYFDLLESCALLWERQHPRRVAVEAYVRLLEHEGRLPSPTQCFLCETPITGPEVSVIRSFHCTHTDCALSHPVPRTALEELFDAKSTLFLDDDDVEALWSVLLQGL